MERRKNEFSALYFKTESYFSKIFQGRYSENLLAIAYYENKPAAGAILTSFKNELFYYQGASNYELTKESQATNLLHYEIIKYAKENDFINYDFGGANIHAQKGSGLYGVYSFKKSFGGLGIEYDQASFVVNKFRFNIIWKLRNLQNATIVKYVYKFIKQ